MPLSFERYRMVDGVTPLAARYFNQVFRDIDVRVASLEDIRISWLAAVDEVVRFGLRRIDELITEPLQAVSALSEQAHEAAGQLEELRALAESRTAALQSLIDSLATSTQAQVTAFVTAAQNGADNSIATWQVDRLAQLNAWMTSFEQAVSEATAELDQQMEQLGETIAQTNRRPHGVKTANFSLGAGDLKRHWRITGAVTASVADAGELGAHWWCDLHNAGEDLLTLAGSLAGQTVYPGQVARLYCDGDAVSVFYRLAGGARPVQEQLTAGTTWTAPLRLLGGKARYRLQGGGASGSGVETTNIVGACGGAGAYCEGMADVTPGDPYPYEVGAGGLERAAAEAASGRAGSDTKMFGATAGGAPNAPTAGNTAPGGVASGADININGNSSGQFNSSTTRFSGAGMLGTGAASNGAAASGRTLATGYGSGGLGGTNTIASQPGRPGVIILNYLVAYP